METPDDAAFLLALDGAIVGWGAGAEYLFGYGAEELLGRQISVLVPPEGSSRFPRILMAVARGERINTDETIVGKDGRRLDVALAVSPARSDGGRVTGARAVARDITGERAEEARGLLGAILESSTDAIYMLDRRGVIRTWNHGAERLYGYADHEAVGLPGVSLVPDQRHDDARMAIDCVLAGEPVQFFEIDARRKDAVHVPVSLNLWPVRDRNGEIVGVSVIACDLTEERLIHAALAESEVRLRESESLAHVGGWVWDVGTGAVQWSQELHRIHGLEPASFAGTIEAHLEPVHPADRERVRAAMNAAVATPEPFEMEYRIVRPDGLVRWIYGRAEVALAGSQSVTVAGLRGISQDVTDRKHARPDLRRPLNDIVAVAEHLEYSSLEPAQAEEIAGLLRTARTLLAALGDTMGEPQ